MKSYRKSKKWKWWEISKDGQAKREHWAEFRESVLKRDKNRCHYCGKRAYQADHVVPRSRGGETSMDNLVACCSTCNYSKGGANYYDFIEYGYRSVKPSKRCTIYNTKDRPAKFIKLHDCRHGKYWKTCKPCSRRIRKIMQMPAK